MSTVTDQPQLRRRVLTRSQMQQEIDALTTAFGSLSELQGKADRDLLTPDERAAMRKLDGLNFLLSRQR